jgi:hypothetical protein
MTFDPQIALAYARALARPRLLGTGEDESVAREIVEQLTRFGWQVERQPFEFVTGVNQVVRLAVLAGEILILLIFWAWDVSAWLPIPLALILLALLFSIERLLRAAEAASLERADSFLSRLCWRLGRRYTTANIVARLRPRPDPARALSATSIYLVAHFDSKGQFIPVVVRAGLFAGLSGGALVFASLTLLRAFFPALTSLGALAGVVAVLAGVPLLFLDTNNHSPGAIDNASGLGLVLHLAECLGPDSTWREKLDVTVLITSAEELALMGAAAYVRANLSALRAQSQNLYILNFDGIGIKGRLHYAGRPGRLLELTRRACAELGLPLARFRLGGVLFDHMPFARQGLDALTLMSIGPAAWWVHTARDTANKLKEEGFRQGGAAALRVIEILAGNSPRLPSCGTIPLA